MDMASRDSRGTPISSRGATFRPPSRPVNTWRTALVEPATRPEALFHQLDGANLAAEDGTWNVHVFSVVDDSLGRWIQLGLGEDGRQLVTLHVPGGAGASHVNLALYSWFEERRVEDLT